MLPSLVVHYQDSRQHPIITVDGKLTSKCIICQLLDERDRLYLALENANALLVDGKDVQAHRCLEHALRNGVSVLPSSDTKEKTK